MNNPVWKPTLPPFKKYKKKIFQEILQTSRLVYQIGESEILRQPSKPVPIEEVKTKEFQEKIAYIKKVLIKYRKLTGKGRGITAVQIGIPQRFSVIYMPLVFRHSDLELVEGEESLNSFENSHPREILHLRQPADPQDDMLVIINPKITKKSAKLYRYPEICMSANPIIASVVRPAWIEFEYYDEFGDKKFWDKKDSDKDEKMYNRVFQHEIDHMDGIINIDKVNSRELILESDPNFHDKAKFEKVR